MSEFRKLVLELVELPESKLQEMSQSPEKKWLIIVRKVKLALNLSDDQFYSELVSLINSPRLHVNVKLALKFLQSQIDSNRQPINPTIALATATIQTSPTKEVIMQVHFRQTNWSLASSFTPKHANEQIVWVSEDGGSNWRKTNPIARDMDALITKLKELHYSVESDTTTNEDWPNCEGQYHIRYVIMNKPAPMVKQDTQTEGRPVNYRNVNLDPIENIPFFLIDRKTNKKVFEATWLSRYNLVARYNPVEHIISCPNSSHPLLLQIIAPRGITLYGNDDLGKFNNNNDLISTWSINHPELEMKTYTPGRYFIRDEYDNIQTLPIHTRQHPMSKMDRLMNQRALRELINSPVCVGAYTSGNNIIAVFDKQQRGWLFWLKELGIKVKAGGKGMKRIKYLIPGHSATKLLQPGEINIHISERPGEDPSTFDGAFMVNEDSLVNWIDNKEVLERILESRRLTGRILFPGTKRNLVKGVGYVVPSSRMPGGEYVDVWTHSINLKSEISSEDKVIVMLDTKLRDHPARTNTMSMINLQELFKPEEVLEWVKSNVNEVVSSIYTDKPMDTLRDLQFSRDEIGEEADRSAHLQRRWASYILANLNLSLRVSQSITKGLYRAMTGLMIESKVFPSGTLNLDNSRDGINVKIPFGRYAPVLSYSLFAMSGVECSVPTGSIRYIPSHDIYVVSDEDWLANIRNHGGCDADDDFYVVYRMDLNDKLKAIVYRSPNAMGEYAIYDVLNPEEVPMWKQYVSIDKIVKHMIPPTINTNVQEKPFTPGFPAQLTTLLKSGEVKVEGLKPLAPVEGELTREFMIQNLDLEMGGPGSVLNLITYLHMTLGRALKKQPCSHEEVVDQFTQSGSKENRTYIQRFYEEAIQIMIQNGYPIDSLLLHSRLKPYIKSFEGRIVCGWLTHLHQEVHKVINNGLNFLTSNMQWCMPPQVAWSNFKGSEADRDHAIAVFDYFCSWQFRQELSTLDTDESFRYQKNWINEQIRKAPNPKECLRAFTYMLHTNPTKGGGYRSDFMVTSGKMWSLYMDILKEVVDIPKQEQLDHNNLIT